MTIEKSPTEMQTSESLLHVPLLNVIPNPHQPRKLFSEKALLELARSIKTQGILQPLVVRTHPTLADHYELVAGERRWRALKLLDIDEVPVIVKEIADDNILEVALLENIQRENLTIIEEAQTYQDLLQSHGFTQDQLARRIGKDRSTIANLMRLLQLPSELKNDLETGRLTSGHARSILALPDDVNRLAMRQRVLKYSWSVRETERQVKLTLEMQEKENEFLNKDYFDGRTLENANISKSESDLHLLNLAEELQRHLKTKVTLKYQDGKGSIKIDYFSLDEFERLFELLKSA